MIDVRRLRVLHHLATYGTVAAAADVLHLTAPAVSQQLAALEREVGMPVVEKHGRTLRLTQAGELLTAHAEIVLADLAAAEAELAALRGGTRGEVRVAAFASAARSLMPAVWAQIGDEAGDRPGDEGGARDADDECRLSLRLIEQEPDSALESLRQRVVDLAVVHAYTVLPREFPPTFDHDLLMRDPVVLVLHPQAADRMGLVANEPVDLARLASAHWLTPWPDTTCYEMIQRACGAAGFVPAIHARSSDFAVLTALVAGNAGVALAPRLALPPDCGNVRVHPLEKPVTRMIFHAARGGTARRPDLGHVIDLLQLSAAAQPDFGAV
jgi:DNA-binding transcriptional LysR family regulator